MATARELLDALATDGPDHRLLRGYVPIKKPWGWSIPQVRTPEMHQDICLIETGGYSSIHKHVAKSNVFIVLDGILTINWFAAPYRAGEEPRFNRRVVMRGATPSNNCVASPGELHQFDADGGGAVMLLEIYTPAFTGKPLVADDIVRFSTNGLRQ